MNTILPVRRALVSVETAKAVLNTSEDSVLGLIDAGKIRFAFDVARRGARRRTIRIFALSLFDLVNRQSTQPSQLEDCLKYILPMTAPVVTSSRLTETLNVGATHVAALVKAREIRELPGRRTCTGVRSLCRASAIQWLKNRRCL